MFLVSRQKYEVEEKIKNNKIGFSDHELTELPGHVEAAQLLNSLSTKMGFKIFLKKANQIKSTPRHHSDKCLKSVRTARVFECSSPQISAQRVVWFFGQNIVILFDAHFELSSSHIFSIAEIAETKSLTDQSCHNDLSLAKSSHIKPCYRMHANFNNFIKDIWSSSTKNIPLEIIPGYNSTNLTSFQGVCIILADIKSANTFKQHFNIITNIHN
ncbi:hypothetical protein BpHYR1_043537 [Brachionus plicatilis]|uniref:Uncharacterized protein n=1 Tax=Brachionus plicatilis TaxID=10195 RepID=A0A3M7PD44_BRAPC|nr:hypothetical protein BpHYR1_043537 [Brachionus plicatilis]